MLTTCRLRWQEQTEWHVWAVTLNISSWDGSQWLEIVILRMKLWITQSVDNPKTKQQKVRPGEVCWYNTGVIRCWAMYMAHEWKWCKVECRQCNFLQDIWLVKLEIQQINQLMRRKEETKWTSYHHYSHGTFYDVQQHRIKNFIMK
jgi:hypothetical protein